MDHLFNQKNYYIWFIIFFTSIALIKCDRFEKKPLFSKLSPEQTGIDFENTIETDPDFNVLNTPLIYNGGGVGIGDINNDKLPDIFFAGNKVSSRLYLNKGNIKFEDITQSAGVSTNQWITGVSMVDINNDGFIDIYLSVVSTDSDPPESRENLLFINNGDTTFSESAKAYGIDDQSFTTHATFLDYNKDGYLDLYLLNHSPAAFYYDMANQESKIKDQPPSYDRLYKNNGDGSFTNVSREAGILDTLGYGLGVVVADFNKDNWPDIYVSNDLLPDDVLYMNNQDGTFTNKVSEYLKHTSYTGMGVDAADFNNDGWTDILQVDMMPEDYSERKMKSGIINHKYFSSMRQQGYHYSYSQNTLQLNNGIDHDRNLIFSEIARLGGVAYTAWSWGSLFGDYNNDGLKDIIVTNGYLKDTNNYDYLTEINYESRFGANDAVLQKIYKIVQELQAIKSPNYVFKNKGNLKFSDRSEQWGFREPSFSYGVAQADLDNDGSLDVVTNNINAPASIYRNTSSETGRNHYLNVKLKGDSLNRQGIGAQVSLTTGKEKQYKYHTLWRGYESTVGEHIHFGLGKAEYVDTLEIVWPDGQIQILTNLEVDQTIKVNWREAYDTKKTTSLVDTDKRTKFYKLESKSLLNYTHENKNRVIDYNIQPLLPYMISKQGPPLTTGDVTGNGLDDVFIGGSAGSAGILFIQQKAGNFVEAPNKQPWVADSAYEDWGVHFFDATGDGKLDLYIASGGYHISPDSKLLQDRLYVNMGEGRFVRDKKALPNMLTSTAGVVSGDFNDDGHIDLFVGGRLTPRKYPFPTRSWLLVNVGGQFKDVTGEVIPELVESGGMVTDAVWMNFNEDDHMDLVTVGEWMQVQFFKNEGHRFQNVTQKMGLPSLRGWWYSIEKGDFNEDGKMDLVTGNLGLNFTYTTSEEKEFGVFSSDFNGDKITDIIFSIKENGTYYPFFGKAKLGRELRFLNSRFPTFKAFSKASLNDMFGSKALNKALHYQVDTFSSLYLQNKGDGNFSMSQLPSDAQLSSIMDMVIDDVDQDGNEDVILAGNIYNTDPETPRNDAGNGLWMRGNGQGDFEPVHPFESGFYAPGNVKNITLINTPTGKALLISNNSDTLQGFKIE